MPDPRGPAATWRWAALAAALALIGWLVSRSPAPVVPPPEVAARPDPVAPTPSEPLVPFRDAPAQPPEAPTVDAGLAAQPRPAGVGAEVVLPTSAPPEQQKAASALLRTRGQALFKQKQFRQALPLFELAVRLDPLSPEAAERLGSTHARTGDSIRAVYYYGRFLELAPDDPLAHDLKEDVDSWLLDHPNPALTLMHEGLMRPLTRAEAELLSELARRMVNTTNPEADLEWFLAEYEKLRQKGEAGPQPGPADAQ